MSVWRGADEAAFREENDGLRPQLMPPMDYLQACALLFTLKWILSQKTGWEPAGFIKKNTEEED